MNSFRFCLVSLALALVAASAATAQFGSFPGWADYDSTFYVGSDVAGNVAVAMDELTIDYHWGYLEFIADFIRRYQNPTLIGEIAHREFVMAAKERGFKIIAGPHDLRALIDNAPVIESYPGGNSEWLMDITGIRLPPLYQYDTNVTPYNSLDDRKIFYAFNADSGIGTQLIASLPCYSIQAMRLGDLWLFDSIGSPDYSRDVRLSVKLFTDTTTDEFRLGLANSDTIAYMTVLRRYIDSGQSKADCRCDLWERFDTIAVTKQAYLNGDIDGVNGFSEVGTYYKLDSLATSLRGPDPVNPLGAIWYGFYTAPLIIDTIYRDTTFIPPDLLHITADTVFVIKDITYDTVGGVVVADTTFLDSCDVIYATLDSSRFIRSGIIDQSDIDLRVYTTGRVPIRLLRTKVNMRFYDQLIAGEADSMIANVVGAMVADTVLDATTWKISISNEIKPFWEPRAYGYVSSVLQREIAAHNRTWQLHTNPYIDYGGLRALSGDLDSTGTKILHSLVPQPYGTPMVPEMYADTARMDSVAEAVHFKDVIAFNTLADYRTYTVSNSSGPYFLNGIDPGNWGGDWVNAIDIARFRYRHFAPSMPVYPAVQAQGYYTHHNDGTITRTFGIASPEHAKSRIWYALCTGADGIHLADVSFHQNNYGYVFARSGDHSADTLEYGSVQFFNSTKQTPYMWLGIPSRFDTIKNTIQAVRTIDGLIGWKNLIYNQAQITVNDVRQNFRELPLLDSVTARHAQRYGLGTGGEFLDSAEFDERDSTYMEITHFASGPGDTTVAYHDRTHYFLILNKRTWPLDTLVNDVVNGVPRVRSPLGYIDARKPIVRFVNNADILKDTIIIEGILSGFRDTALMGEMTELSWLKPGSAELYRVTVLPTGISQHSTAYNNAVHSENPSTDSVTRDRLVVYERDSVVFVRSVAPDGVWSRELMLSSPSDTVLVNGKRTASNFFPSLAVLRDGTSFPRFVWERDSLGYRSVVTAFIAGAGEVSSTTIDSTLQGIDLSVVRHRLSVADSLVGPPALTPSIVQAATPNAGVGDGFVISWADHGTGINVAAMRGIPFSYSSIVPRDTAVVYHVSSSRYTPQVGQYPTLATAQLFGVVNLTTGTTSGATFAQDTTFTFPSWITTPTANWRNLLMLHVAWQQGDGVDVQDERIYYARVGVNFAENPPGVQPSLWVDNNAEHVSKKIAGCSFLHPSIAADSVRVGVAFEAWGLSLSGKIILRFRDTAGMDPATGLPVKEWETYAYAFGETLRFGRVGTASGAYARPSLTHFPVLDSAALELQPEGGMTWILQTPLGGRQYRQRLYRYGWVEPREVDDGNHPSLTLVPLVKEDPFEQSSIFYRGPVATRTAGENDEGQDVWYYTGRLLNSPGNPLSSLFNLAPQTGSIIANGSITGPGIWHDCGGGTPIFDFDFDFDIVFTHGSITHPEDDRHRPGDPTTITAEPGLPPTFFGQPGAGVTIIDDLSDATGVVRTSLFKAKGQPVTILRGAAASDSIAVVLDQYPYDAGRSSAADIWSVVELVRASDSVVLWRGDTISARGLDTNDIDTVSHEVEVPVGTYASFGETVFIQVRAFVSPEVLYEVGGGFSFQEEPIGGGAPKAARQREAESSSALLQLSLIPNPVQDGRTTLHVSTELVGRIEIDVWDVNGRRVATLPLIEADRAGTYSVDLDLEGLLPGSYLVRANTAEGGQSATVRMTVME